MIVHFVYWAIFGVVLYVLGVGGFTVDMLGYLVATFQQLVHSGIHGPMTICLCRGATCSLTFFDGAFVPRSTISFALLFIDSSIDESQFATMNSSSILLLKATFARLWNHVRI
jgi:hypothetical protein